jgi:hypothetical protein
VTDTAEPYEALARGDLDAAADWVNRQELDQLIGGAFARLGLLRDVLADSGLDSDGRGQALIDEMLTRLADWLVGLGERLSHGGRKRDRSRSRAERQARKKARARR